MHVEIEHEVIDEKPNGWALCFQWCRYVFPDRADELGYRFIWRREDGSLQAARGQARIPDAANMFKLIEMAKSEGWFESCEHSDTPVA